MCGHLPPFQWRLAPPCSFVPVVVVVVVVAMVMDAGGLWNQDAFLCVTVCCVYACVWARLVTADTNSCICCICTLYNSNTTTIASSSLLCAATTTTLHLHHCYVRTVVAAETRRGSLGWNACSKQLDSCVCYNVLARLRAASRNKNMLRANMMTYSCTFYIVCIPIICEPQAAAIICDMCEQ
jgi:hypothetical protein